MNKSKTSLTDLRNHLFDVIERLKDSNDPDADEKDTISIETAKAINQTAGEIIESAKVEVEALKIIATYKGLDDYEVQSEFLLSKEN